MKLYTKTGDKGQTGLFGGKRISKGNLRIESYGTVDELNSWMGLLASYNLKCIETEYLQSIQSKLFDIGSQLAANPEKDINMPQVSQESIFELELKIDAAEESLEPLKVFILPGGSTEAANAHIARTICRRAERRVVELSESEYVHEHIIIYLNRLSDYLFVLARLILHEQEKAEIPWKSQ